jgi:hypothetical protein
MPFVVYRIWPPEAWEPVREIELSGQEGPLAQFVRTQLKDSLKPLGWRVPAAEILGALGFTSRLNALVFQESKANGSGGPARYRVEEISGFSDETFTAILPRLSSIPEGNHQPSYRALYLRGGIVDQRWSWVAQEKAVDLCIQPVALEFFLKSVQSDVQASPAVQPAPAAKKSARTKDRDPLYYELRQQLNEMFPPVDSARNGGPAAAEESEDLHVDLDEVIRRGKNAAAHAEEASAKPADKEKPAEKIKQAVFQWAAKTRLL